MIADVVVHFMHNDGPWWNFMDVWKLIGHNRERRRDLVKDVTEARSGKLIQTSKKGRVLLKLSSLNESF
jgi:hypothetical protein